MQEAIDEMISEIKEENKEDLKEEMMLEVEKRCDDVITHQLHHLNNVMMTSHNCQLNNERMKDRLVNVSEI